MVVARELDPLVAFSERFDLPLPYRPSGSHNGGATVPLVFGGRIFEEAARASGASRTASL